MSSTTSTSSASGGSSVSPSVTSSSSSSSAGSSTQGAGPSFTVFPGPSGSPCNDPGGCAAPPPATLYLYTFLSTLILLLVVSGGIIARSVVLRRRHMHAVANGWVPTRRRENYSSRTQPVMFEVFVAPDGKKDEEGRWSRMKPFSAADIVLPAKAPVPPPAENRQQVAMDRSAREQMQSIVRFALRHGNFRPPPAPPPPIIELAPPSSPTSPSPTQVRVGFLVAMPSQAVPSQDEEEELPYLEFGILDVGVVDAGKMSGTDEGVSESADLGSKS